MGHGGSATKRLGLPKYAEKFTTAGLALLAPALALKRMQGAPISFVLAHGEIDDWILLTVDGPQYRPQIDQEFGI